MKKTILISVALIFFGLAPFAFAEGFVPLAPIPGLTQNVTANTEGLANFFNNLYKFLIGAASVLAVIMIIWGGLRIATNQDNVSVIMDSKGKIINAILGLVLVLSPVLVFTIINPSILNLSINLERLDTASGFPTGTGGTGGTGTQPIPRTDGVTGCTVVGSLFKKATCPTQQAAQDFASRCTTGSGNVSSYQAENSSGYTDTSYYATCDTRSGSITGPYVFLDTSHYLNPVQIFSNYRPLASSATNPNNGVQAEQFATTCTRDGGVTCVHGSGIGRGLVSTSCTYSTSQPTSQSNKCYSATLSCKPSSWLTTINRGSTSWLYVCSDSPSWTPIQ